MSPDVLDPKPLLAPGIVAGPLNWLGDTELLHPKEPGIETTPSRSNASRSHVRIAQVPRDFVSQVDYDWLVVDTNCWTDADWQ